MKRDPFAFDRERTLYKVAAIMGLASVPSGGHSAADKIKHADELADLAVASDIARFDKLEAEAASEPAPAIEAAEESPKAPDGPPPPANVAGGA